MDSIYIQVGQRRYTLSRVWILHDIWNLEKKCPCFLSWFYPLETECSQYWTYSTDVLSLFESNWNDLKRLDWTENFRNIRRLVIDSGYGSLDHGENIILEPSWSDASLAALILTSSQIYLVLSCQLGLQSTSWQMANALQLVVRTRENKNYCFQLIGRRNKKRLQTYNGRQ